MANRRDRQNRQTSADAGGGFGSRPRPTHLDANLENFGRRQSRHRRLAYPPPQPYVYDRERGARRDSNLEDFARRNIPSYRDTGLVTPVQVGQVRRDSLRDVNLEAIEPGGIGAVDARGFDYNWQGPPYRPGFRYREYWNTPGPYQGIGPSGYRRQDETIQEDICERLTRHGFIDASQIQVSVDSGVVTLSGSVPERRQKYMAEDLADAVTGVQEVHNQLKVL